MRSSTIFFVLLFNIISICQIDSTIQLLRDDQYGNLQNRRESILDGNLIRTLFDNTGMIGHWPNQPSGEWPKGTGHGYFDGFTFFVSAEIKDPGTNQLIHPLEIYYREWVDHDPINGDEWTLTPVPGYFNNNSQSPALSKLQLSWPDIWPSALNLNADWNGHWYSYFGKDNFYPSLESFFVMDDSKDAEYTRYPYNFYPVAADTNRKGLGLRIEARTFQWNIPLAEDILFMHHDIYNISDYDYEKAITGFYIDFGIGSTNDSGDDNVGYDENNDLVFAYDADGVGTPDNFPTGYLGVSYLETPKQKGEQVGLSSLWVYRLGDGGVGGGWPKDDESIWQKLSTHAFDVSLTNANISALMGAGTFMMDRTISGKKHRTASAMIFANDKNWLMIKKQIAQDAYNNNYIFVDSLAELNRFKINMTNPVGVKELKDTVDIKWNTEGNIGKTTTYINCYDRDNYGLLLGIDSTNKGSLSWNTETMKDGLYYRIVISSFAENGFSVSESEYFNINNHDNPQFLVTSPENYESIHDVYEIKWLSSNLNESAYINIFFKPDNSSSEVITTGLKGVSSFWWNSLLNANTQSGTLYVQIFSGTDTLTSNVYFLKISNAREQYSGQEYFYDRSTHGTGFIELLRIDSRDVTGDNYLVSFRVDALSDTVYDVSNVTKNERALTGIYVDDNESPYFDGLRIKIHDDPVAVIDSLTRWENSKSNLLLTVSKDYLLASKNINAAANYRIDFYDEVKDTGYIQAPLMNFQKLPVNLFVTNTTSEERNKVAVRDMNMNNVFDLGDQLEILEFTGSESLINAKISWDVKFNAPEDGSDPVMPSLGDAYFIITTKPFQPGDSLFFMTSKLTGVVNEKNNNKEFYLSQNYPNPFNPSTKIRFSISEQSQVKIIIYDITGREIETLINKEMPAGIYETSYNPKNTSSGVYFIRLTAGNFSSIRKMIYLK